MSRNTQPILSSLVAEETGKICEVCGEFVHDEYSCLSCACGCYFAYQDLGGDLVRPILPDPQ